MAATPDHGEEFVDTLYNNDSVIRATSKVMSDSELVVKSLGTTVDHINRYKKVLQYGGRAWSFVVSSGGVAAILWTYIFAFDVLGPLLGAAIPLCVLFCMVLGLMVIPMIFETWLDNKVMEMVDNKLAPQVKQLQASITELQTVLSFTVAISHVGRVLELTQENYQYLKSIQVTAVAVNSMATNICSICVLLRKKRCRITEKIANKALPQLKQKFEKVKSSVQLLHATVKLVTSQN